MKSFVITIMDMKKSVESAKKCIASMPPEFDVQMHPAITPKDDPEQIAENLGISLRFFRHDGELYSRRLNCIAAFLSHYSLWKKCAEENEEYQIFEHDAICVNNIPIKLTYRGCVSLGAPSYGSFQTPKMFGVQPLNSKQYFPGAHAYRLKPHAAQVMLSYAENMAGPTDVFLANAHFQFLEEFYPWPVIARDTFTTIQNVGGCGAKHNFSKDYEIL